MLDRIHFRTGLASGASWLIPPFRVGDDPVVVFVDLGKELVEFRAGYSDPGSGKRASQFSLVDFSVVIAIDGLEHLPEARLGVVDKGSEL